MIFKDYILEIRLHLIRTHAQVLELFNTDDALKTYKPEDGGWTIVEILEHIGLTSFFLMKLVGKGADKAMRKAENLETNPIDLERSFDLDRIDSIGLYKSFDWIRPEHMEPSGEKSEDEIKAELISQMNACLNQIERMKEGQGTLCLTTMSVNGLGKIDVYEYIYFLSKHAERHIQQMKENEREYRTKTAC